MGCTQEAMEDNPGQVRNLESLVNSYSQVLKFLFCWGKSARSGEIQYKIPCIRTELIYKWYRFPKQATLALGGITWPDINYSLLNLPCEVKLQKLQSIQGDFALLNAFSQRLSTSPERNQIYNDLGSRNYAASSSSIPSTVSCSLVGSYPAISVNPFNFQAFSLSTGCCIPADQKALRMNLLEPVLTDGGINPPKKPPTSSFGSIDSEDLNYTSDISILTGCATGVTPSTFAYRPEPVCPCILGEKPQSEVEAPCYEFPDLEVGDIGIST